MKFKEGIRVWKYVHGRVSEREKEEKRRYNGIFLVLHILTTYSKVSSNLGANDKSMLSSIITR